MFILNVGTSRTILFEGIPADTREPLPFLVRAFNQLGQEVGIVTRNVRIGEPPHVTTNLYICPMLMFVHTLTSFTARFQFGLLRAVHQPWRG